MNTIQIGQLGEKLATNYLISLGYEIITRNYHSRYGEIDIIGQKNNILTCFEVKSRSNKNFGYAEDAVTPSKIKKIHRTFIDYIYKKKLQQTFLNLDILVIEFNQHYQYKSILHLKI